MNCEKSEDKGFIHLTLSGKKPALFEGNMQCLRCGAQKQKILAERLPDGFNVVSFKCSVCGYATGDQEDYGQYRPSDYYCDSWTKPEGGELKGCALETCPLINDYDELPYALQLTYWQVLDWFVYAVATRCEHHKLRTMDGEKHT